MASLNKLFAGDTRGFSLIELVLAIGIVAFALVTLLGLVPVGIKIFQESASVSIRTQIIQQMLSLANQSDFEKIRSEEAIPEVIYYDAFGGTNANNMNYVYS
ncbi:MAG: Verru_Chthon cassette protein B, partial [Verrucomicrobiota bacterium]